MRHGQCLKCGGTIPEDIISRSKREVKYCSARCRSAYISYRHRVKTGSIKKPGVGSGGAQWGKDNHQYKTGIGNFSKRAFSHYGKQCNRCRSTSNLLVHHRNHDRTNNNLSNLEVLCKKCHQDHHCLRDDLGRYKKH